MDEPPEVKQFLQELGEGGRAAQEPGLPEDGLPASGARLASCGISAGLSSIAVWNDRAISQDHTAMHVHGPGFCAHHI